MSQLTAASSVRSDSDSTAASQGTFAASSAATMPGRNMQYRPSASLSGRWRHACPPGAPIHTSGNRVNVSPPGSHRLSVVRIRSQSPARKDSLALRVLRACNCTLIRG